MSASYQYQQYQQYQQQQSPQQQQAQPQQQQAQQQYQQSYQQPQQYQQGAANSQYGYQQQYQQYYQQQTSQQQSPTQQYSLQSYQQQYSTQQYPQQQVSHSQFANPNYAYSGISIQQYPTAQQGAGAYQEQQGQQGSYAQQSSPSSAQSCFNCGVHGHFAQACPEPKRHIPAGALNPDQHRRQGIAPSKGRGQIVTKFNPQGHVSQASPGNYTPAYSSGGYPQYPPSHPQTYTPSYTPTTPQSAPSSAQSWAQQQGQQYSQYYQGYQQAQNNGYYSASSPQQQTWPVSGTPVSSTPYGAPGTDQASPVQSQFGQPTQTPQSHHGQSWGTPGRSVQHSPTLSQHRRESASDQYSPKQEIAEKNFQSNPLGTKLFSPRPLPEIDEDAELEEDDLTLLDLPELPSETIQHSENVVTLICMPVPSNFIVADALFPMDPPAPETGGRCYSKYIRHIRDEVFFQGIRQSVYWNQQAEDPAFRSITVDEGVVAVDDCRSKVMERRMPQEYSGREGRSESRSAAPAKKDSAEAAASLELLEKALAQAKADIANREKKQKGKKELQSQVDPETEDSFIKQEEHSVMEESLSPSEHAGIDHYRGYEHDAENVLASLGVTGTAKPVGPPSRLVSQNASADIEMKSHDMEHIKAERADRYDSASQSEMPQSYQYNPEHPQDRRSSQLYDVSPSTPYSKSRGVTGSIDGTAGYTYPIRNNSSAHRPTDVENSGGNYQYQSENQAAQHGHLNRSAFLGNRKRAYEERSASEESEEEARRQEDDITPKLKRRQPKVAEAYSRRW